MDHWVKCLLHKHDNLGLDSQHLHISQVKNVSAIPELVGQRQANPRVLLNSQ